MPLPRRFSPFQVISLSIYLLALVGLGSFLLWPRDPKPPLGVDSAGLSPAADRILLEGEGFSASTQAFLALDVSNGRFLRHTVPTLGRGGALVRVDRYLYATNQRQGLLVLDLATPEKPRIVGTLALPGLARSLAVEGGVAYVVCDKAGLALVDVSQPTAPRMLANLPGLNHVQAMTVRDGRLYAAIAAAKVESAVAVANPRQPRLLGQVRLPGQPLGVALRGSQLLVAVGRAGLVSLELGDGLPRVTGRLELPGIAHAVVVLGEQAYVACVLGGLAAVDLAGPLARLLTLLPLPGRSPHLVAEAGRLYLLGAKSDSWAVEIERPDQPRLLGGFNFPGVALGGAALGRICYVSTGKHGIQVVDLSKPAPVQQSGDPLAGEFARWIEAQPDLLTLLTNSGRMYLFTPPQGTAPQRLGSLALQGESAGLAVAGGYAYAVIAGQGLEVVDLRNPRSPVSLGIQPLAIGNDPGHGSNKVALTADRGAVIDAHRRLWLFETAAPGPLQLRPGPQLPEPAGAVAWGDGLLYVASLEKAEIIPIQLGGGPTPADLPDLPPAG